MSIFLLTVFKLLSSGSCERLHGQHEEQISESLDMLQKALHASSGPQSLDGHHICAKGPEKISGSEKIFVDIFIAFDEAHTLVKTTDNSKESSFVILCRILGSLIEYPLFMFFLSMTGSITQLSRPRDQDPSNRISSSDLSAPPYIHLGFDQLMQGRKVFDRWKTLDDVTSLDCAAHMGRPL